MGSRRVGAGAWLALLSGALWATTASAGGGLGQIFADSFETPPPVETPDQQAARLLDQATYGGRAQDIARLRQLGTEAWLQEQFAAPASLQLPYLQWVGQTEGVYQQARLEAYFIHAAQLADPSNAALTHNDQLRQRVAFALSQLMVVSDKNATLLFQPFALGDYYDTLARHAFGNYRDLLEAVTLHPAMGKYLSMLGNRKTDAALNIRPDENYAREIMQLFSIGLVMLEPDGRVRDGDAGTAGVQPIPTYNQNVVRGFAHVFTGWNFAGCTEQEFRDDNCEPGNNYESPWFSPMQAVEALHDNTTSKQLLTYPGVSLPGGVLSPGGNAQQELDAALDNIFHHPNVGPFVAKHLIQRLVTSNPTPAYVQRVAGVFGNNGQGVRGDLRAVVRAVLLDDEARNGHLASPATFGKLRDPITKLVRLWRVAPGRSINGRVFQYSHPEDEFAQLPLSAPSVFNFFKPDFAQPGEIRDSGLVSPEFQIHTDTQLVSAPNYLGWRVFLFWDGTNYSVADADEETLMDYAALRTLAADPAALVDHLDLVMMSGQMSDYMRDLLIDRLNGPLPDQIPGLTGGTTEQRRSLFRVQQALYLIVNSPEFSVQR
ncbi:MAG: DUF1800 domain-containing protein [Chiayiivirga sp.]|jgi:uncharacterized protein (DUF1800 family)|uniref:DUF1800 domain-containing protein n=1 Tax=Chiayiivirga sp. TaxID=2041042 RepID=UPI0025BD80C1|nr:DUF1800 family protein [Chiayiivirga sp.]MCI1710904.1 DUF1800 domain-containing protein [Chiayiivirga sp.]MCI1728302.1 DUF1800 domain-containing protein [Chiayiivirga sp.]